MLQASGDQNECTAGEIGPVNCPGQGVKTLAQMAGRFSGIGGQGIENKIDDPGHQRYSLFFSNREKKGQGQG
ncbi:hypothetical protein ES703_39408 [subsurface metagenome]